MKRELTEYIDKLKADIERHGVPDARMKKLIRDYYRIGLTFSSNAIEGNTLTESETKIVVEEGITIGGKPLRDHLEAVGHSDAYDFIYGMAKKGKLAEVDIKKLHRLFYHRIDSEQAGKYRKVRAVITGSRYPLPLPENIPGLMKEYVALSDGWKNNLHPVEAAAKVHKEFVFIHPFVDGNGRLARLLMNFILLSHGYGIALIPPVIRSEYIYALEKAHEDDGMFVELIGNCVKETMQDYLRLFG